MTAGATVAIASETVATASATVVTVRATVTGVRARAPTKLKRRRRRRNNHGNVTARRRRRRRWTPAVLSPPQELPVLRRQRAEDRLQGRQAVAALRVGARQDRSEPHYGGLGEEEA